MLKFIIITFLQLTIFVTLSSALDHNQKVKSDVLKAMQRYDTKTLKHITKEESKVIKADAKLQKMIDAYYEEEAHELEVIKSIIANKNNDDNTTQEENTTKLAVTPASEPATVVTQTPKPVVVTKKPKSRPKKVAIKAKPKPVVHSKKAAVAPKKVVSAKVASQPVKKKAKSVPVKVAKAPVKKPEAKVPEKKAAVVTPVKPKQQAHASISTKYLMGQWKQTKKKKKITLKMLPNNRFILEERANNGTLKLEGYFDNSSEGLSLDINKITYNVRSRDASVHRKYIFKNISKKTMVLLDEKGEVVYQFERK